MNQTGMPGKRQPKLAQQYNTGLMYAQLHTKPWLLAGYTLHQQPADGQLFVVKMSKCFNAHPNTEQDLV